MVQSMDTFLPTKPESNRQLIKRSFRLYKASFKTVIFLSFLLAVTAFIPRILSDSIGQEIFASLPPLSLHRLWLILVNLGALLFIIAILWRMHCIIHRIHEPLVEDLMRGLKKLFYVFLAGIIESAIIFAVAMIIYGIQLLIVQKDFLFNYHTLGMILTFLIFAVQLALIIYISTLFFFLIPLIAVENNSILVSIERSILLGWNHWWRIFSLQMTPWVVYILLLFVIRFIFGVNIHIYFIEHGDHTIWTTLLHIVIFTLYVPWVAALIMVQLKDLELRKKISSSL